MLFKHQWSKGAYQPSKECSKKATMVSSFPTNSKQKKSKMVVINTAMFEEEIVSKFLLVKYVSFRTHPIVQYGTTVWRTFPL